ncbi:CBS domain-containing protein [Streptomyces sp. NPDC093595]|uniref:CBS domain-containing protein n=1 Tax=Streptomyces sp. NPDC093595 TaxID=3366045 RepID=UPI00382F856D
MVRKAREVMTLPALAVGPQTRVADLARIMREENISAVLVIEGGSCGAWSPGRRWYAATAVSPTHAPKTRSASHPKTTSTTRPP